MTNKPWTAPGLTAEERTLTLLGRPLHRTIVEALDAHARDAVQQERERIKRILNSRHENKFWAGGVDKEPDVVELRAIFAALFTESEPPREDAP